MAGWLVSFTLPKQNVPILIAVSRGLALTFPPFAPHFPSVTFGVGAESSQ